MEQELSERHPASAPAYVPPCNKDDIRWPALRDYFRTAHRRVSDKAPKWQWVRPRLAVALEGGGSKSAPFALGALAGLHESGMLNEVDVISSVSGGSYAAYFCFSRLLDAKRGGDAPGIRDPNAWFRDCTPSVYRPRFADDAAERQEFCAGPKAIRDDIAVFAKNFPYQAHIRYYQDLIHWKGGLERVGESFNDRVSTYVNVGVQFLQTLVTVPIHFVMNSLLAMPENSSPSRYAYRAGIERAYAHTSFSWNGITNGQREPDGAICPSALTGAAMCCRTWPKSSARIRAATRQARSNAGGRCGSRMRLNSSYTLFGAYYDLARHIVSQIGWNDAKTELKVPQSLDPDVTQLWPICTEKSSTKSIAGL